MFDEINKYFKINEEIFLGFGWRVAVVVLGFLGLSGIVYGILYRPLPSPGEEEEKKALKGDTDPVSS